MMKNTIYFLLFVAFLSACTSSSTYFDRGEYDNALQKSVSKLIKKPTNVKEANILERAYTLANQRDNEIIQQKKEDGSAQSWDQIATIYSGMKARQQLVKKVLPLTFGEKVIDFETVNYDDVIKDAKKTAAKSYFDHAKKLMEGNDRKSNRSAYYEFQRAKNLSTDFPDIETLMQTTKDLGTALAGVSIKNETDRNLSADFLKAIISYNAGSLNKEWAKYVVGIELPEFEYDYLVTVVLKKFEVSPESQKENTQEYKKDVQDGWIYEYDAKGNVKKDTAGNDIKKPKMKTIKCKVTQTTQYKKATVYSTIDYIDNRSGEIIRQENVNGEAEFKNAVNTANGDQNALSSELKKQIGGRLLAFPSNDELIKQAAERLKSNTQNAIKRNATVD
jgi:hypothetical protein